MWAFKSGMQNAKQSQYILESKIIIKKSKASSNKNMFIGFAFKAILWPGQLPKSCLLTLLRSTLGQFDPLLIVDHVTYVGLTRVKTQLDNFMQQGKYLVLNEINEHWTGVVHITDLYCYDCKCKYVVGPNFNMGLELSICLRSRYPLI